MKLNVNELSSRYMGFAGVAIICALTATSCTKKNDDTAVIENDNTEVGVDNAEETMTEVETVAIGCDDNIALKKLNQTLRATLTNQTDRLLSTYSNRAGADLNMSSINTLIDSVLIDIAVPTEIQPVNTMGMVTCRANLSMTLPNNDMNRAKDVYRSLGGASLNQTLSANNITANNNMLVSKSFNYVVGMQGGQTIAKIVGEPAIVMAVADIAAKSKLKATLDANQPVVRSRPRIEQPVRVQPTPPVSRPEPARAPESSVTPSPEPELIQPQSAPELTPSPKPSEPVASAPKASAASKNTNNFTVPDDDNIEMVIIEEEGTY